MHLGKRNLKMIGIYIFMLLFVFVPYIKVFGLSLFTGYLTFVLPVLLLPWVGLRNLNKYVVPLATFVAFFAAIVIVYNVNIFTHFRPAIYIDTRGIKLAVTNIFLFLSVIVVYQKLLRNLGAEALVYLVYCLILGNGLLVLLIFSSVGIEQWVYSIVDVNVRFFEYPIRRPPGLMYDGFSYLSSLLGLGFVMGVMLYYKSRIFSGLGGLVKFSIMQGLLLLAIVVSGRSGFVVCLVGLVTFVFLSGLKSGAFAGSGVGKTTRGFIALLLILVPAFYLVQQSEFGGHLDWAFSAFVDIVSGDAATESSMAELLANHFFLPDSISGFLFGILDYNSVPSLSAYHSDVGYVQLIHGFGAILLFLVLLGCMLCIKYVYVRYQVQPLLASTIIVFVIGFLVLNFKDLYFVSPYPHFISFYLFFVAFVDRAKRARIAIETPVPE